MTEKMVDKDFVSNITGGVKIKKYIFGDKIIIELVTANKNIQKMKYQILYVYKNVFNELIHT